MLHAGEVLHVVGDDGFEVEAAGVGDVAEGGVEVGLDVVDREERGVFPERGGVGGGIAEGEERVLKRGVFEGAAPVGGALAPAAVVAAPRTELIAVELVSVGPPGAGFGQVVPER